MQSGQFDMPVYIHERDTNNTDVLGDREVYIEIGYDWAAMEPLETIKDNEMETSRSHDTAFGIARLTFRRSNYVHLSTNRYVIEGTTYEMVGQPIHKGRDLVYINVRTRDDL